MDFLETRLTDPITLIAETPHCKKKQNKNSFFLRDDIDTPISHAKICMYAGLKTNKQTKSVFKNSKWPLGWHS